MDRLTAQKKMTTSAIKIAAIRMISTSGSLDFSIKKPLIIIHEYRPGLCRKASFGTDNNLSSCGQLSDRDRTGTGHQASKRCYSNRYNFRDTVPHRPAT